MSYTINFTFDLDKKQAIHEINASNSVDEMILQLKELSLLCDDINQDNAEEEAMNFFPPFAMELNELSFTIVETPHGFPSPKCHFKNEDALIELSELVEAYEDYGSDIFEAYKDAVDCENAIEILEERAA